MVAIEMSCACGATLSLTGDKEETEQLWHLTHRFTSAHTVCGYIDAPAVDKERRVPMKKHFFKPIIEDDEE